MSEIRCIYVGAAPPFPASDQHPDAIRYTKIIGGVTYVVDAIGGEPSDAEVIAIVAPDNVPTISRRQALLYLLSIGKSDTDVIAAINGLSDANVRAAALIDWSYPEGGVLRRGIPLFDQLGPVIGIATPAAMDDAFRAAALL